MYIQVAPDIHSPINWSIRHSIYELYHAQSTHLHVFGIGNIFVILQFQCEWQVDPDPQVTFQYSQCMCISVSPHRAPCTILHLLRRYATIKKRHLFSDSYFTTCVHILQTMKPLCHSFSTFSQTAAPRPQR